MLKQMQFMNPLIREWMRKEKSTEKNVSKRIWKDTVKRGKVLTLVIDNRLNSYNKTSQRSNARHKKYFPSKIVFFSCFIYVGK